MKKLFTVLAIALFTITISAQQTKPATPTKKEATAKKCTAEEKAKCEKTTKSCCSKK